MTGKGRRLLVERLEDRTTPSILFGPAYGAEQAHDGGPKPQPGPGGVPVYLLFWGSANQWNTGPSQALIGAAARSILSGPYLQGLAQYGITSGATLGGVAVDTTTVANGVSPAAIRQEVENNLLMGNLPEGEQLTSSPDPLYFVMLPPGITSSGGGFTNGHDAALLSDYPTDSDNVYYGWVSNQGGLDGITAGFSQELADALTDPQPGKSLQVTAGSSWTGSRGGEVADAEAQNDTSYLNGLLVGSYWSQQDNAFVIPDGQPNHASLVALASPVRASSSTTFTGTVATITDFNASDPIAPGNYTATITWGDGGSSAGSIQSTGSGHYTVSGTHSYTKSGAYTLTTTVKAPLLPGQPSTTATGTAAVDDPSLSVTNIAATPNAPAGSGITGAVEKAVGVALDCTFTDGDSQALASAYTSTVDWGDGHSDSVSAVATGNGGFDLSAVHAYAEEGTYTITVTIDDAGGSSTSAQVNVVVADAPLLAGPASQTVLTVPGAAGAVALGPDGNLWFPETAVDPVTGLQLNRLGRVTPGGSVTEFSISTDNGLPGGITRGPDGNLWFTETLYSKDGKRTTVGTAIGRMTTTGQATLFALPAPLNSPTAITAGPDGNLWFVVGNDVGRITTAGVITEFSIPTPAALPTSITAGPDGNLWFTEVIGNQIGRISPAGVIQEFALPTSGALPVRITAGPDGNLWFTEEGANKIGRITPAGAVTEFALATPNSSPSAISAGPNGDLFFAESIGRIGEITPAGQFTAEYPVDVGTIGGVVGSLIVGPQQTLAFTENTASQVGLRIGLLSLPAPLGVQTETSFTTTVARFADTNPAGVAGDFTATIDWGDGSTSAGTITPGSLSGPNGVSFNVAGTHTYTQVAGGTFAVTVTVSDSGGASRVLTTTVGVAGLPAAQQLLQAPTVVRQGSAISSLVTADFNGDGKPDLAVANDGSAGSVGILLNNGNGTFASPVDYSTGTDVLSVVVADFNSDGKLDLAVLDRNDQDHSCTLSILLGNGDGTFGVGTPFGVGHDAVALAVGDFNGDRKPDLIVIGDGQKDMGTSLDGGLQVLLGNGDGTFASPLLTYAGSQFTGAVVGDFNGDGRADLIVSTSGNVVLLLTGNGDGTFQAPRPFAAGGTPVGLAVADFNGDGNLDLAVSVAGNGAPAGVSILLGNGVGNFAAAVTYRVGNGIGSAGSLAVADLNNDGVPDLVVANGAGKTASELLGKGDGTLGAPQSYLSGGPNPLALAVADFTGDGRQDVAVLNVSQVKGVPSNLSLLAATPSANHDPVPANLPNVSGALSHSPEYYSNLIVVTYLRYLNRAPGASEVGGWLNAMQAGLSDEHLEAGFIGSPEYIANHGGQGAGWVTGMYKDLLGRSPSQDEVNGWVSALNNGEPTTQVAFGFAASPEREGKRVRDDYFRYLGRTPGQSEVDGWVYYFSVLGGTNENVVAGFVGSPEYFSRHGSDGRDWLASAYRDVLHRAPGVGEYAYWLSALG